MVKTRDELRIEVDKACSEAKAFWDQATTTAKANEEKIRELTTELEGAE
jgi:hypothetical protein